MEQATAATTNRLDVSFGRLALREMRALDAGIAVVLGL